MITEQKMYIEEQLLIPLHEAWVEQIKIILDRVNNGIKIEYEKHTVRFWKTLDDERRINYEFDIEFDMTYAEFWRKAFHTMVKLVNWVT